MRKYGIPLIIFIAGFALSTWAYTNLRALESGQAKAEFERRSANIDTVLNNGIERYATLMSTHKQLTEVALQSSGNVELDETTDYMALKAEWDGVKLFFNQIAKNATINFPGLIGLGWATPTQYSDIPGFELVAKLLITPGYEIREVNSDGGLVPVTQRNEHFPVFYIEPMENIGGAHGIDLSAPPLTLDILNRVRETGVTESTPPIEWIRTQTGQLGFLVFDPVYHIDKPIDTIDARNEGFFAFSFGVILVDSMLDASLSGLNEQGIDFFVFTHVDSEQIESGMATPHFASNGAPSTFQDIRTASIVSGLGWNSTVNVMGQDWSLYCYPSAGFASSFQSSGPLLLFLAGTVISLLLAAYLYLAGGRTQLVEVLIKERTRELVESTKDLEKEIANRVEADEQRRHLESQLLHTQKMDSVGQLAGGVAHDFNNLLQAIMGYGDLAKDKISADSEVSEDLQQMMEAGDRAKILVNQLLAFSRRQVLDISELNIDEVVRNLVKMVHRVIGVHIKLDARQISDLDTVRADKGQIEQILMNLCVNARDAMGDEGTLTIAGDNITLDNEYCLTHAWASPGRYVRVSVKDTGHGMTDEVMEQIFEPFFTTKEVGKGTGLGLSTVFGIVRQHEGLVQVESEVGKGTTFSIYLPVAEKPEVDSAPMAALPARGGSETILLADDDRLVRQVADTMLTKAGYTVYAAEDGEQAIVLFNEHAEEIDLALLDVVMPKVSGNAVGEHIHTNYPHLPVLFSSGYSKDDIHTNFVLDEGTNLIQKPYHRDELLKRIREILERHA